MMMMMMMTNRNLQIETGLAVMGGIQLSLAVSRLMEARLAEENVTTSLNPCCHSPCQIFNLCITDK